MKNFFGGNSDANANSKNSPSVTLNKVHLNNDDEVESIINIHIASRLNENTFHLSPNQTNFYVEQLEEKLKSYDTIENPNSKQEFNNLETMLISYMALIEQLKKQVR
jgi:hypothetical protein